MVSVGVVEVRVRGVEKEASVETVRVSRFAVRSSSSTSETERELLLPSEWTTEED